jgi:molybdopterin converting factor small subunit
MTMAVHRPAARLASTIMTITIQVPGVLRANCEGAATLAVSAASVRAALEAIERSHPALYRCVCDETGAVRRHVNLFVNTSNVRDGQGLDTPLVAGDVLTILPAVSGG